MNIRYFVKRKNGQAFYKIFSLLEIERGDANQWLAANNVRDDELSRDLGTGLKDKNGKEVFEMDKVQPYVSGRKQRVCTIRYRGRSFCMTHSKKDIEMDCIWYYDFEIIGRDDREG